MKHIRRMLVVQTVFLFGLYILSLLVDQLFRSLRLDNPRITGARAFSLLSASHLLPGPVNQLAFPQARIRG
jgi:hypothetical protein